MLSRQGQLAARGIGRDRGAIDEPGQRKRATFYFDHHAVVGVCVEFGAVRREGDAQGLGAIGAGRCIGGFSCGIKAAERRRQVGTLGAEDVFRCGWKRCAMFGQPLECVEQQGCCGGATGETGD